MTSIALQAACRGSGITSTAFRAAMRAFTGIVSLITARTEDGEWRGMAATAVTSISMEPPTCLVCVNRDTSLHPAIIAGGRFCINAMHQDHHGLMWSFTNSKHRDSRFQSGRWLVGRDDVPFLEDAQSNIFCEMFDSIQVGTHDVIFGHVVEVKLRLDHDPLLYGHGAYLRQAAR